MKKGWQTKPFEDCIESVKYTRKIQRKDFLDDGQFPIVSQEAEFTNGYWNDEADVFKISKPVIIFGDHTQVLKYVDFDFVLGADGVKILPPRDFLRPKFLFYQLQAANFTSLGYARHYRLLKELEIKFPPLPEQHRIVGLLDEAFEGLATAKANAEKNLQNARALFESHLQSVFSQRGPGWVEKPLSELCDIKHGYAFEGEFFSSEGDYVLLTPGNFYEWGGYRDRGEKQKYYSGDIPRDYVLNEGDLLVAMTEQAPGLLGSPILVPESDKFLHNQRLGLVTKKPGIAWTNEFFFHVFNTQPIRKAIHTSASGVKVRHTSPTKIGDVVVAFPTSLAEQKRIVTTLASLMAQTQRLTAVYEQKLAALEALTRSLLHQAFAGEL
jgi:type I restriction enzyme, S subunit